MKAKTAKDYAEEVGFAHANLNAWAAVVGVLENGTLSGRTTHAAKQRVIKIAHAEMQKHLREYDAALSKVVEAKGGGNG